MTVHAMAFGTAVEVGSIAPVLSGTTDEGQTLDLGTLYKKGYTLVYFYPKADTPGCTKQACSLRDEYSLLQQNNMVVLGVSADTEKAHSKFAAKFALPFPLIADTDKKIIGDYDVWGRKMVFGREMDGIVRTTFVIDAGGIIERVITDIDTVQHAKQVLQQ